MHRSGLYGTGRAVRSLFADPPHRYNASRGIAERIRFAYWVPVELKRNSLGFQYQQQKYGKDELSRAVVLCATHGHKKVPPHIDVIELEALAQFSASELMAAT